MCFLFKTQKPKTNRNSQVMDSSKNGSFPAIPVQAEAEQKKEKVIFILSGQSNMAGRGGVHSKRWDHFIPPECKPNPSISRLNAKLHWEEAKDPLHSDIDVKKVCGIGPGMPFANSILNHLPFVEIGLVPCAVGGTAIDEWEKGRELYEEMVKRARNGVIGFGGRIRALLWYQGESDTDDLKNAEEYKIKMERLIGYVRKDLGIPDLPIIQVALASGNAKYIEIVRKAQLGISLPNVYCVDAKGLPLNEDHLHLTTEAQVRLGKMLADEYLKHN